MKFLSKYTIFHSWKCVWKYRLRNGSHFVWGRWVNWRLQTQICIEVLSHYWFRIMCHLTDIKNAQLSSHYQGPFLLTWIKFIIPASISNYIYHKKWNEIAYPLPNFKGCTIEVWEWISHPTFYWACDYLSMLGLKSIHVSKRGTLADLTPASMHK